MDFANQTKRERKLREPLQAVVHGGYVIHDLFDIPGRTNSAGVQLELEEILQRALGSFNLRAEDRLPLHVHGNEEIGIGQKLRGAIQAPQPLVGA